MTLFYNPKTRKPHVWVMIAFVLVPVLLFLILMIATQGLVKKSKEKKQESTEIDIFAE